MDCKPAVLGALGLFAWSLCLLSGCGSNSAPANQPGRSPGYFSAAGRSPGEALELDLQEKAKAKPAKRAG